MIVAIAGTGTEIGKSWVTAAVASALRERGVAVTARKPVQSFAPGSTEPTDADVLSGATGEKPNEVCPPHRWLPCPMAPPMAAEQLGLPPFTIADLVSELGAIAPGAIALVETAGGVRSPLADDGDSADFARALRPALIVLVADAGLGTINLVRLSTAALAPNRPVVYLNRFDEQNDLHARNREWLETRVGLDIVTDVEALANRIVALRPVTS